jgi:ribosomal protein L29
MTDDAMLKTMKFNIQDLYDQLKAVRKELADLKMLMKSSDSTKKPVV